MSVKVQLEDGSLGFVRVLDHGHVRLVDRMGDDLSIVRAARVSYNAAARAGKEEKSDFRLLRYLMANEHTSPFEMVEFKFDMKMPIFVARQIIRHRTASVNEVSARYTVLPGEFYIPDPVVIGKQSLNNKQARDLDPSISDEELQNRLQECQQLRDHCQQSYAFYEHLLSSGWPRELARMVLPLNIYTQWFWKIDLKNLLHFLKLRLDKHAQWEAQQYGEAIYELVKLYVPQTMELFEELVLKKQAHQ